MSTPLPELCCCGCADADGGPAHRITQALAGGDLDAAISAGLLDSAPCAACTPACRTALLSARDERRAALAARERFRARQARLARLQAERAASRNPPPAANPVAPTGAPALPHAAAAALQRALTRAAGSTRR